MVVDCRVFKGIPQGGATPIEIGRLLEIDFDHDFDFDIDPEFPRFENKIALHPSTFNLHPYTASWYLPRMASMTSRMDRKALTTSGSNCWPDSLRITSRAMPMVQGSL
jgi:hypothetical protein